MKKVRNVLLLIVLALVLVMPFGMSKVRAEGKVKVYIFEAGDCPWCEKERNYLEGLDSYGEKFEIVRKELYVDHVDWAEGKDYELGKKVAEAFNEAGFTDAAYTATPFVVISDVYAAAAYSEDLEGYINTAYEKGDKDIVSCIAEGGDCAISPYDPNNAENKEEKSDNSDTIATIILLAFVAGVVAFTVVSRKSVKDDEVKEEKKEVKEVKEEKKEEPVKKVEPVKEEKEAPKTSKKHKKRR